jgi:hypothetical protein
VHTQVELAVRRKMCKHRSMPPTASSAKKRLRHQLVDMMPIVLQAAGRKDEALKALTSKFADGGAYFVAMAHFWVVFDRHRR